MVNKTNWISDLGWWWWGRPFYSEREKLKQAHLQVRIQLWPCLVWLSWLIIVLCTEMSLVWFLVRAHAQFASSVLSCGAYMRQLVNGSRIEISLFPSLSQKSTKTFFKRIHILLICKKYIQL